MSIDISTCWIGLGVNTWRHTSKVFKEKLCNRMMEVSEKGKRNLWTLHRRHKCEALATTFME